MPAQPDQAAVPHPLDEVPQTFKAGDSYAVRDGLVTYIRRDLLGPWDGESETLSTVSSGPRDRYLVGMLGPRPGAVTADRIALAAAQSADGDSGDETERDDNEQQDRLTPQAAGHIWASSMGMSFTAVGTLSVTAGWGCYRPSEEATDQGTTPVGSGRASLSSILEDIDVTDAADRTVPPLAGEDLRVVELTLVNRQEDNRDARDAHWLFQTQLEVTAFPDDQAAVFFPVDDPSTTRTGETLRKTPKTVVCGSCTGTASATPRAATSPCMPRCAKGSATPTGSPPPGCPSTTSAPPQRPPSVSRTSSRAWNSPHEAKFVHDCKRGKPAPAGCCRAKSPPPPSPPSQGSNCGTGHGTRRPRADPGSMPKSPSPTVASSSWAAPTSRSPPHCETWKPVCSCEEETRRRGRPSTWRSCSGRGCCDHSARPEVTGDAAERFRTRRPVPRGPLAGGAQAGGSLWVLSRTSGACSPRSRCPITTWCARQPSGDVGCTSR